MGLAAPVPLHFSLCAGDTTPQSISELLLQGLQHPLSLVNSTRDPKPLPVLPPPETQIFRAQPLYLLPNIFELLDALGHLLEAAINLT